MNDVLQIKRGSYSALVSNIDKYPEYTPCFATDNRDFYIKYQNTLVNVSGGAGSKIVSIEYSKTEQGVVYYKATLSDGSIVEFPFEIKLDTTTIAPMELTRMKTDGTIEGTGIIYNPTLERYESRYDFKFPSNSIWIGENIKIGQSGGFVYNHTKSLNKDYIMLDYENDPLTGSKKPIWYKRGIFEPKVIIQSDYSESLQNVHKVDFDKPSYDRQLQAIYFIPEHDLHNFAMEFTVNGEVVDHYPSEGAWNGTDSGLTLVANGNTPVKIPLVPFFSNLVEYDVVVEFKADEPVDLKSKDGIPSYGLDLNRITRVDLATMEDIANIDTTGLAKADLSNVNEDAIKNKGFMKTDMEDVDLSKLYDKGIDANLADKQKVADLEVEVNRIKTDISPSGKIFTYRGNKPPVKINDDNYKAYYISFNSYKDDLTFDLPTTTYDDVVFSLDNNDKENSVVLTIPQGYTVNGRTGSITVQPQSVLIMVLDSKNWKVVMNGYIPNSLTSLMKDIQANLKGQLNTIPEIQAQLKDRLHTVREIETALDSKLHTYDAIEANMVQRGFSKGFSVGYGMLDTNIAPHDDSWVTTYISPNAEFIIPPSNVGTKYLALYMPEFFTPLVKDIKVNTTPVEFTENEVVVNELYYKVLIMDSKIDTTQTNRLRIEFGDSNERLGLELDDGKTNISNVNTLSLKNINLQQGSEPNTAILKPMMTFIDGNTKKEFSADTIQSLDNSIRISALKGVADLSKGKSDRNEGIHVMLGNDELINSRYPNTKLYFSDYKVKGGMYVYPNMKDKSFILQDIDPQDDPNVSGGTTFLVAIYYEPNTDLENIVTQGGNIVIELVDSDDNPILDVNGQPMGVQIDYNTHDIIKKELYVGECQIKSYTEVHPKIRLNFPSEELISVGSNTQICIQSITKEESGGPALDSFMLYTGYRFQVNTRYYGFNSMNLASSLIFDVPEANYLSHHMELGENLYLDIKNCRIGIENRHLIIKDTGGLEFPVWSLSKYYSRLDSYNISGKTYKVTATLIDKNQSYRVALLEYKGTEFIPPKPKLLRYNNTSPVFTTGWQISDTMFISEDAVSGDHKQSKDFTIPQNSSGIAIIMYATTSIQPMELKLKDLEGDITPWFNKIIIKDNFHISEKYLLEQKEMYKSIVALPTGLVAQRYTVNNTSTRLPIGVISGGDGKIINDNSWHDPQSYDPNKTQGNFKFLVDGRATFQYTARIKNEESSLNQVNFKLVKVSDGSTVANSEFASTIEGNRTKPKMISSDKFTFDVKANETYAFYGASNKADGFYLEVNTDGVPLLEFIIEFDEMTSDYKNILDKLSLLDDEIVYTKEALDAGVYIQVDYDKNTQRPSLSAKTK